MENSWLVSTSSLWGVWITWQYVKGPAYGLNPQVHFEFNWESTALVPWTHEWSCPFRPKEGWGPRIKWTPNMATATAKLGKTVIFFFFLSLLEEVELLEMKRVLGSKPISCNPNWSQHQSRVASSFFPQTTWRRDLNTAQSFYTFQGFPFVLLIAKKALKLRNLNKEVIHSKHSWNWPKHQQSTKTSYAQGLTSSWSLLLLLLQLLYCRQKQKISKNSSLVQLP